MAENEKPGVEFDKENFMSLFLNAQVPMNYKIMLVVGLGLYTLSPVDFVPDIFGFFGFADDVGIAVIAAQVFTHFANKRLEEQHNAEQAADQAPADQPMVVQAQASPPVKANPQRRQPTPPTASPHGQGRDLLHDEPHEQFLAQRAAASDDEFERLVREKRQNSDGSPR